MYQSLYRRYRPKNFDEIVGQEKVVEVIKNQISLNKIGHAYLFTGVRGTGKTSIAKIFARAINCLESSDGNPCMRCSNCLKTIDAVNVDIIEMDAASNNGVDDIRMIKEEVDFLPTQLKYKVYIIDEVHMLSTGAFNALLKTVEEPPAHVKFVLATTEPQKLPATIVSRCQRFEFLRLSEVKIAERLKKIADECGISIEENAIHLISNLANGSMRDGISILESVSNIKGVISSEKVREVVGIPDTTIVIESVESFLKGDINKFIHGVNKILDSGKEPINYITEFLKILEVKYLEEEKMIHMYTEDEYTKIKSLPVLSNLQTYKLIKEVVNLINSMKFMENKKAMLIAGFIAITDMFEVSSEEKSEVKEEIKNKENSVKAQKIIHILDSKEGENSKGKEVTSKEKEEKPQGINEENKNLQEKTYIDVLKIRKFMLANKDTKLFVALNGVKIEGVGNKAKLDLRNEKSIEKLEALNSNEAKESLEKAIKETTGKVLEVEYIV